MSWGSSAHSASKQRCSAGCGFEIGVDVPRPPRAPAGGRGRAYRIATEALTNVVRHAGEPLHVDCASATHSSSTVDDDGIGLEADTSAWALACAPCASAPTSSEATSRPAGAASRHAGRSAVPGCAMSETLRVLVADDHPLFREGLRAALDATPGLAVVAEAADGAEAVTARDRARARCRADGSSDARAVRSRRHTPHPQARPETHVLVLTMFDGDSSVFAAIRAGAKGYLLKGADQRDVERAIRTVARARPSSGPR